ncbi:MAG: hypothetical protein PF637_04165 [Spirochaetes bacterium]|nr:hypothetical protein [Spirochaetota bacterium]
MNIQLTSSNYRKFFTGTILFVLLLFCSCRSFNSTYSKKQLTRGDKVVVLPFTDFEKPNSGSVASSVFHLTLLKNGVNLVEREFINQLIQERKIEPNDLDEQDIKILGRLLQADYILTGALSDYTPNKLENRWLFFGYDKMEYSVGITARLISVNDGSIIWVGAANHKDVSYIRALEIVTESLIDSMIEIQTSNDTSK